MTQRQKPLIYALVGFAATWMITYAGYHLAKNSRMSVEKVQAYAHSVHLRDLTGSARRKAILGLANRLNALSLEERRRARMGRIWQQWLDEMTEVEKAFFIEISLPTGFKQMLTAFGQLPEDKRRKTIEDAVARMREAQEKFGGEEPPLPAGTNNTPFSPELQEKIATLGLKTFYSESSAQTKAELAPLLEELQRLMESGAAFRGPRRP